MLLTKMAELEQTVTEQREEIARLKGLKGRPDIKPSGMDKGTEPAKPDQTAEAARAAARSRPGSASKTQVSRPRCRPGSRFKGYEPYLVQELVIVGAVRSATGASAGSRRMARRSSRRCRTGIDGHFGPELRRFVLMQYHQGQSTLPRLAALLQSVGVAISKRAGAASADRKQEDFLAEAADVLRAGLETSPWVSVDDTGARHAGKNGFCTQIGNDRFTWFGTRSSKSRLNFLDLLRAGHTDYVLNDAAYGYMRKQGLSAPLIARLAANRRTVFADQAAWLAHLDRLGLTALRRHARPGADRHRGRIMGQRPGARVPAATPWC